MPSCSNLAITVYQCAQHSFLQGMFCIYIKSLAASRDRETETITYIKCHSQKRSHGDELNTTSCTTLCSEVSARGGAERHMCERRSGGSKKVHPDLCSITERTSPHVSSTVCGRQLLKCISASGERAICTPDTGFHVRSNRSFRRRKRKSLSLVRGKPWLNKLFLLKATQT